MKSVEPEKDNKTGKITKIICPICGYEICENTAPDKETYSEGVISFGNIHLLQEYYESTEMVFGDLDNDNCDHFIANVEIKNGDLNRFAFNEVGKLVRDLKKILSSAMINRVIKVFGLRQKDFYESRKFARNIFRSPKNINIDHLIEFRELIVEINPEFMIKVIDKFDDGEGGFKTFYFFFKEMGYDQEWMVFNPIEEPEEPAF